MESTILDVEYFYPNSVPGRTVPHFVKISIEKFSAANLIAALVADYANLKQYPVIRYEKLGLRLLKHDTTLEEVGMGPLTLWLEAGDMSDLVTDALSSAKSAECRSMQINIVARSEAAQQFLDGFGLAALQRTFWNHLDHAKLWNKPLLSAELLQQFKEEPISSQFTITVKFDPSERSGRLSKKDFTADKIKIVRTNEISSQSNEHALYPFALFIDYYSGNQQLSKPYLEQRFVNYVIKQLTKEGLYANQLLLIQEQCLIPYTRTAVIKRPHGALFYGPPGTGKSFLAEKLLKALAPQARLLYFGSAPSLFGGKVGETEKRITELFNRSRTTPYQLCFIFLDEFDSIAESRTAGNQQDFKKDFLNHLISLLGSPEYSNVFLVAATNFKDKLDEAVLRWGRASEHFLFAALSSRERLERLKHSKIELLESQTDKFLDATFNFTIAMLDELFSSYYTMDTKTFDRLIDKANTLSFKYPITKFNTHCLMPANQILEAERNKLFADFLVESTINNFKQSRLYTGRININLAGSKARMVFEKTNGTCTYWDEPDCVSKGSIMKRLQLFAKMLDMQHVRVIDRKFYLDHDKTFYNAVKEAITEESRCYKGSMFVFMISELIIAEPTQIGFSYSESDNESRSNQVGVTKGTNISDAQGTNTNRSLNHSTSLTFGDNVTKGVGSHVDKGSSTGESASNQRTLTVRRDGESKSSSESITRGTSSSEGTSKQYSTSTSNSDTTSVGQTLSTGESYTRSVAWSDSNSFTSSTTTGSQFTKGMTTTYQILNPTVMADLQLIFQETLNCANEQLPHIVFIFEGVPEVIVQKMEVSFNWCTVGNILSAEKVKETNLSLLLKCLSNEHYREATVSALAKDNAISDTALQYLLPQLLPLLGHLRLSNSISDILNRIQKPTLDALAKMCTSGVLKKLVDVFDKNIGSLSQTAFSAIISLFVRFSEVFWEISRLSKDVVSIVTDQLLTSFSTLIPLLIYNRESELVAIITILKNTTNYVGRFQDYSRFALAVRILAEAAARREHETEISDLMSYCAENRSCAANIVKYTTDTTANILHVAKAKKALETK